jgi:hypothetical protein
MLHSFFINIWAQEEIFSAADLTFSVIEIFSLILYRFQQLYSKVFIVGQV